MPASHNKAGPAAQEEITAQYGSDIGCSPDRAGAHRKVNSPIGEIDVRESTDLLDNGREKAIVILESLWVCLPRWLAGRLFC